MFFRRALFQATFGMSVAAGGLGLGDNVIDLRDALPSSGTYKLRDFSKVTTIVVHHTATTGQGWGTINDFHRLYNGWARIGYHMGVSWDAMVFLLNDLDRTTNHCGGCNSRTIGVALLGDFHKRPMIEAQGDAAEDLIRFLMELYPNLTTIKYHGEMKSTACPGKYGIEWVVGLRSRMYSPIPEDELPGFLEEAEKKMMMNLIH